MNLKLKTFDTLMEEMTGAGKLAEERLQALLSAYSDAAQAVRRYAQSAEAVRLRICMEHGNQSLTSGGTNVQAADEPTTPGSGKE